MIHTITIPLDSTASRKLEALLKRHKKSGALIAEITANFQSMEVSVVTIETRTKVLQALDEN